MKNTLFLFAMFLGSALAWGAIPTGGEAPRLEAEKWLSGKAVELDSIRGKEVAVLLFWNGTMPGGAALRSFMASAVHFKGKPARFIALSCDNAVRTAAILGKTVPPFPVAVVKPAVAEQFLRPQDRIPAVVVIGFDGKLLWRGTPGATTPVVNAILNGKFDLKESIRKESVAMELGDLLRNKKYEECIVILDRELARDHGNPELVSMKCAILLKKLNAPDRAMKAAADALASDPKGGMLYELAANLAVECKQPEKLLGIYQKMVKNLPDDGALLMKFCNYEMSRGMESMRPDCVVLLAQAAVKAPEKDPKRKGVCLLDYSRAMYVCGRPDLSLAAAKKALPLLKGSKEWEAGKRYMLFYHQLIQVGKTLTAEGI